MSANTGRVIGIIVVPLVVLAALGTLAVWWVGSFLAGPAGPQYDKPTERASVSLPHPPGSLAWSPDGAYLAAGAWGWSSADETAGPSDVYVVDVAKASVAATLPVNGKIQALAFAPDGKWLAVATVPADYTGAPRGELKVFDAAAFTAKLTVKANGAGTGFLDLAWAPDGKSLYALDGADGIEITRELRRWAVPAFAEQAALDSPKDRRYTALAASPDGRTLAVAEKTALNSRLIRLFDLDKGTERSSFKAGEDVGVARLGFTADGKAVGVFDGTALSWWDAATGRPAKPDSARFAVAPASLGHPGSHASVSPDGGRQARGYEKHRGFGDLGWDRRQLEFGAFVEVTAGAPVKTWTWRLGDLPEAPAVAFSPDGTKLAGTVKQPDGDSIRIWDVPK